MTFAQRRNRLTTHFSERNPLVKQRMTVYTYIYTYVSTYIHTYIHTHIRTYMYTYIHTRAHARARARPHTHTHTNRSQWPRDEAWVYCCSLAGFAGSNPAGSIGCRSWVLYVVGYRSLRRADHSFRGVLPTVVCLSVIMRRAVAHWEMLCPECVYVCMYS